MQMQYQIEQKLLTEFDCHYLEVINESHMHSAGADSHFKVIIATDEFDGERLLQRHRRINQLLADELANHIHALALHTYTVAEWAQQTGAPLSPKCLGGSKIASSGN